MATFALFLVILAIVFVFAGVTVVRQGYRYTIEYFGKFVATAQPGFNFYMPFFYRVGRKINMMEQVLDIPGQEIITRTMRWSSVDGVVFFQVLDAAKAAYEVSDLYQSRSSQLTTTNLRTVMGSMDLDETLSKRDEINARLLNVVDHATAAVGRQDHPRRGQGHPPARRHRQRDGPADEGRAREARLDPRSRRHARVRDPARRGREAGPDPRRPRAAAKPPSATPRRASARPRPKPRRRRWSPTRSPAATRRRSTISSRRNMSRRSASSRPRPTPRRSCSRSRRRS